MLELKATRSQPPLGEFQFEENFSWWWAYGKVSIDAHGQEGGGLLHQW